MKVKDGIIGFVVGDALGVPVEFYSRKELEDDPVVQRSVSACVKVSTLPEESSDEPVFTL